ncbi:hypothetical protein EDB92DRAFT_1855843 [Lactarius akahatsu]|uniref:Uncharacterized protein n=1 Tax=Lactarius akahatsu TaxID=416441 RepID=A0AAD4Q8Q7_9AGAM|nr:hypothetical protein EDB92DRAFT_1855843 [Lactarius akahatsu]
MMFMRTILALSLAAFAFAVPVGVAAGKIGAFCLSQCPLLFFGGISPRWQLEGPPGSYGAYQCVLFGLMHTFWGLIDFM